MHMLRISGEILCQIILVHPRCTLGGSTKLQPPPPPPGKCKFWVLAFLNSASKVTN